MSVLMTCSRCGGTLEAGLRFCPHCGLATDVEGNGDPTVASGATVHPPPEAPTQSIPAQGRPQQTSGKTPLILSIGLVLSLLIGASFGFFTGEAETAGDITSDEIVASLPVGPEGGAVEFDDGGKVEVPPGAVQEPETITVYRTVVRRQVRVTNPTTQQPLVFPPGTLAVYYFGPFDVRFLRPVTIVLPLPPNQTGIVFIIANGQLRFIGGNVNLANGTITFRVNDFRFSSTTIVS